jgi:hypothetical protein
LRERGAKRIERRERLARNAARVMISHVSIRSFAVGARIKTRCSSDAADASIRLRCASGSTVGTPVSTPRNSRSGSPTLQPSLGQAELANRAFVRASALLEDGHCLPHFASRLEVAHQDHGIGQVARVDRRLHVGADEALVRSDQDRRHAGLAEVSGASRAVARSGTAPPASRSCSR